MSDKSRLPDPAQFFPELGEIAGALTRVTMNGSIPRTTIHLVQLRIGQLVGSTYHVVRQAELLRKSGATEEQTRMRSVPMASMTSNLRSARRRFVVSTSGGTASKSVNGW